MVPPDAESSPVASHPPRKRIRRLPPELHSAVSPPLPSTHPSSTATHPTRRRRRKRSTKRGNVSVNVLPNDVLLEIFHFYVDKAKWPEQWQTLVHVCQRWRDVVFASPTRLNLRLVCTHRRPVREIIDVWPGLPIIVSSNGFPTSRVDSADNIVAALERHDRVRDVSLWGVPRSLLERSAEAMQGPFPVLTFLRLEANDETAPALPDSFLGGSAPRLRHLYLKSIPFPGMRRLLLSATNLIQLNLSNIPHSGYISPDTIVAGLSGMARLQGLWLGFQSPRSRPSAASRRPPPATRAVLPSLTRFWFKGVSEYLEDVVAQIETPLLDEFTVTFFHQLVYDISQLPQFIGRTPKFKGLNQANVGFVRQHVGVKMYPQAGTAHYAWLKLNISCCKTDWLLSSLAQIFTPSLSPLSTLERLDICEDRTPRPQWQDDTETSQWTEIFRPFSNVKNLYLSEELAVRVAPALQDLANGAGADLLPALQNVFLEGLQPEGPVQEAVKQLVAARQQSDCPVAAHNWERRKRTSNASSR